MVHDERPISDTPLPGAYYVSDRYRAATGQIVHNCSVMRLTHNMVGSVLAMEVEEARVLGEAAVGVALKFIPAVANIAAGNVDYLPAGRMVPMVTHGPVKVMNGGTGVIWPGQDLTPAGPATDAAGATWMGLITARTNAATQSKIGVAMDYFAAFDNPGDIGTMWADPSYLTP